MKIGINLTNIYVNDHVIPQLPLRGYLFLCVDKHEIFK